MSKKQAVFIIVIAVFFAEIFNIFFGSFVEAKISTWPLLNRWHILSPQAPIVITNRQTVRVDNSADVIAAAAEIKPQISAVALVNGGLDQVTGSAVNLTSDGDFVTGAQTFSQPTGNYFLVLSDGRSAKITARVLDAATSLVFFKTSLSAVPVVNLANSSDAGVGDQLIFASGSLQNYMDSAVLANVNSGQGAIQGQAFLSDYPRRSFGIQPVLPLASGEVLIDTSSGVLGVWNGNALISSDVLKRAISLYLADNQKIIRPAFGFSYEIITRNESTLTGSAQGARVLQVSLNSAARQAGLISGDIITAVNNNPVSETSPLEEMLENYNPGDKIALTVARKTQTLTLNLTVGELH